MTRLGKRIVIGFQGYLFIVLHLMIAGRLQWFDGTAKVPARFALAIFEFDDGTISGRPEHGTFFHIPNASF